ncbi:MAG: helix-turn-helix transcriptional regulator [Crocinitomicaceae bacterium]|nr:helix-turn-helix transcriptional regulator [Crocinitomicaceae bacterium]
MKGKSLSELKDKHFGESGSPERDQYEFELTLELLGEMIKQTRLDRDLTQEQLGELIGVQKAQISKLERNASNVTVATILKVFKALQANVKFKIEMLGDDLNPAS